MELTLLEIRERYNAGNTYRLGFGIDAVAQFVGQGWTVAYASPEGSEQPITVLEKDGDARVVGGQVMPVYAVNEETGQEEMTGYAPWPWIGDLPGVSLLQT